MGKLSQGIREKIIKALTLAMLPMFAIVFTTYEIQRDFSYTANTRLLELLTKEESHKINQSILRQSKIFMDWTEVDIYGASIEFETLQELKDEFRNRIDDNPSFQLFVITDKNGVVLEYMSKDVGDIDVKKLQIGKKYQPLLKLLDENNLRSGVIHNKALTAKFKKTVAFSYPAKDSAENHIGYYVAAMNPAVFLNHTKTLQNLFFDNDFPGGHVELLFPEPLERIAGTREEFGKSGGLFKSISEKSALLFPTSIEGQAGTTISSVAQIVDVSSLYEGNELRGTVVGQERWDDKTMKLVATIPERELLVTARKVLRVNVLIAVLGTTILFALVWILATGIVRPVKRLVAATERVARGDYSTTISATTEDEVGLLTNNFNKMTKSINEHISNLITLRGRLENILRGTKRMATGRERNDVLVMAAEYIMPEFTKKSEIDISFFSYVEEEGGQSTLQEVSLVQQGEHVQSVEQIPVQDEEHFVSLKEKHNPIIKADVVLVPVLFGEELLGYWRFSGASENDVEKEKLEYFSTLNSSLAISLMNIKHLRDVKAKATLEAELSAAQTVQEALLPQALTIPSVEYATSYTPAAQTGGDWFNLYYDENEHRLYFYVGDVTGHGIPSALITGVVCGAMYSGEATIAGNLGKTYSPEERLLQLAEVANLSIHKAGKQHLLMTMAFFSLDLTSGELLFVNAAHNFPFWVHAGEQKVKALASRGSRLGFEEKPHFGVKKVVMQPRDVLFVYTDGLVENTDSSGNIFTEKNLKKKLTGHYESNVSQIKDSLMEHANTIWQGHPADDDVTVLVLKWHGPVVEKKKAA